MQGKTERRESERAQDTKHLLPTQKKKKKKNQKQKKKKQKNPTNQKKGLADKNLTALNPGRNAGEHDGRGKKKEMKRGTKIGKYSGTKKELTLKLEGEGEKDCAPEEKKNTCSLVWP